jgi:hypothetical protein
MEPRKPKDVRRIIRRAGYPSAAADLKEFDNLLSQEMCVDPSLKLSSLQKKQKTARERRLRLLSRRLLKGAVGKSRRSR